MSGRVLIVVLCLALLDLAVGGATAAPRRAAAPPSLRLLDTYPITMRGIGFRPHEHLTVIVTTTTRLVRVTRAAANGTFTLKLGADSNACPGLSVTATGNRGSHATLKRVPGKCPAA